MGKVGHAARTKKGFAKSGPPWGSYLRPGRNNHTAVGQLLAESRLAATGIVFDPCLASQQRDIAVEARRQGIEVVLDPSQMPVDLRRGVYMERFLRPASDMAVRAARAEPAFEKTRRRLDSWRQTLGSLQQIERQVTEPLIPEGQRIHRRRGA